MLTQQMQRISLCSAMLSVFCSVLALVCNRAYKLVLPLSYSVSLLAHSIKRTTLFHKAPHLSLRFLITLFTRNVRLPFRGGGVMYHQLTTNF
ncbi:hypothetical protein EDD86DRAFT_204999, partial [Gorgonomyces haynaldii]